MNQRYPKAKDLQQERAVAFDRMLGLGEDIVHCPRIATNAD
jgi:hypothetical protein